jgi:dephospho-CoA kinase
MAPPARRPTGPPRSSRPWKNGPIPVVGLVGGIGSGKSAAAARFAALGAFVIDADKVGHALIDQKPVRELVVERFGPCVLDPTVPEGEEPRVDRRALGAIVFKDPAALKALEAILHPRMRRTFEKAIDRVARRRECRAVVLDAAILFEAGWDDLCDRVLFVDAPREARAARVAAQRGWDEAALAEREKAQWPLERKKARADAVLANGGVPDDLRAEVDRAWAALRPPKLSRLRGG